MVWQGERGGEEEEEEWVFRLDLREGIQIQEFQHVGKNSESKWVVATPVNGMKIALGVVYIQVDRGRFL